MADDHALGVWIWNVVETDFPYIVFQCHLVLDLHDLRDCWLFLQLIGGHRVRGPRDLLKMGLVRARHDHLGTLSDVSPRAAGVVHMVMREHEILDRLESASRRVKD